MKIKKLAILIVFLALSSLPIGIKAQENNGWVKEDGKTYYYESGVKVQGFKKISDKTYFFSYINGALKEGWQYIEGKPFYLNKDGTVNYGWKNIDKKNYYFGEDGFALKGFQTIENKTYFFSNVTFHLKEGWQYIEGKPFYLNEDGTVNYGWKEIAGNMYYFGSNGFALKGFQEIEGKKYFFSNVNYILKTGIQYINNKPFYLNEDGTVYYGWKEIDKKKYYFGSDGFALKGFQTIEGKNYFFSNINYILKTNWQNINNQFFYLTQEGEVVTGLQTIEGRQYNFNDEGFLQGFKNVNGKLYYYNPDGTQAKGVQRMAGLYFKFDSITGAFEKYVNQKIVIDVSSHNGNINWEQVKNAGIVDGVILRLGYSVGFVDTYFLRNVNELNRLGIPYSVYLFSYAVNPYEAGLEADFVIRTIRNNPVNIASNLFSIYYDLESWSISSTGENSYGISKDDYGGMITTFADKIKSNLGINARVYASKNYVYERFPSYAWPYATWIAQWGPAITYKEAFEGWQYTNNGSIPGINGRVDMSIFYY